MSGKRNLKNSVIIARKMVFLNQNSQKESGIHTYKNGKAVHLGDAEGGASVGILKNKKGIVCSCADVIGVYKWKNGKLYRTERYIWGFSEKESSGLKDGKNLNLRRQKKDICPGSL